VYLNGLPLSAIDVAASPKKLYAIHTDHLHRPILLTDAAKAAVWSASYEPFGKVRTLTGPATQNLGLPGQWFQLEHGLAYNWHRHYDPTTGRYTTPDPLGFVDGPSVFAYVGSAPHVAVDPDGLNVILRIPSAFCQKYPALCAKVVTDVYDFCRKTFGGGQRGGGGGGNNRCLDAWETEIAYCNQYAAASARSKSACRERANNRLGLCQRNGGRPVASPAPWSWGDTSGWGGGFLK
jgi:RHS repeat-associated protein